MSPPDAPLVLITGATDGIGRETARTLVQRGATVLPHGRSAEKLSALVAELEALRKGATRPPLVADLERLGDVRALIETLGGRSERPTVLINNAGIFADEYALTEDGFERTMAVNHFAHFVLTQRLLALPGSALKRIVNVSSMAHRQGWLDLEDLGAVKREFDAYGLYAASKLANVLFTVALAPRLAARGITVNALHPGVVSTKLLLQGFGMEGPDSLAAGARTSVWLALEASLAETTGQYFSAQKPAPAHLASGDPAFVERFYQASRSLTGEPAL